MAYTTIDDPSAHFQTLIYTGNNTARDLTNDGNSDLQPDLLWLKGRDIVSDHGLIDSTRGIKKVDADKLLIKGFFNEVINNSKWAIVHDKVSEIIDRKYMNLIGRKNG